VTARDLRKGSVLLFVVSAAATTFGQTQPPPKLPWGIGAQSAITLNLPADVRRIAEDDLEYDDGDAVKGVRADLNGDGVGDFLLQSDRRLCGNGGCVYVLCDGATRKKLGLFFGSVLYVYAERTHGYADVATYSHISASSATFTEYSFDGAQYSTRSKRTVDGVNTERLLRTLQSIPIWQPHQ
jgi:hypothetical protein